MPIATGQKAPSFTLKDQNNTAVSLQSFRGQDVILYFYPKDDTPGCTKEACGFRDLFAGFQEAGVAVLGVSPDQPGSHVDFINKYKLPFTLLSDPDKKVMRRYGAWGEKNMYGKKVMGVIRSTLWIGPDGKIKKHWRRVAKAADHPEKILALLSST